MPAHKHKWSFCGRCEGLLSANSVSTQNCEVYNGWSMNKAFIQGIGCCLRAHSKPSYQTPPVPAGERRAPSATTRKNMY